MINGLPVVTAPAEIDVTTAEKLQTVLAEAAANGHAVTASAGAAAKCSNQADPI